MLLRPGGLSRPQLKLNKAVLLKGKQGVGISVNSGDGGRERVMNNNALSILFV